MSYFLKKTTPSKKGLYLQIYEGFTVPGKGRRNKSFKALGYVCDLIEQGIEDPIAYAQAEVDKLNQERKKNKEPEIGDSSASKNLGYFIIKALIDCMDIDDYAEAMCSKKAFRFNIAEFIRSMIYAQIVSPGSKHKAFEKVIPNLYGSATFSYDQILDGINYIGSNYEKFIELFNHQIEKKFGRNTDTVLFDCTNYYFEIDIPSEDKQKGPSKENRNEPIIGQALMLDANQIPVAMKMYPGNESEKPLIRETIEDMKTRYNITGKTIQIADKGLNCARNIYSAVVEANDGYIFSKSVLGSSLNEAEKKWVLLENEYNVWKNVYDANGNILYRYKEETDDYEYHCKLNDGDKKETYFTVKEKRIVTFTPSLAKKRRAEILKEVDKAKTKTSIKAACRENVGSCAKYLSFDDSGKKLHATIDEKAVNEALAFAGYNMLVTSEIKSSAREIYNAYHSLWRIEESFRIMKTYLEARPVYVSRRDSIYGHFLICYLSLTVLRLLELNIFEDRIPAAQLVEFIRDFTVTEARDGSFINNSIKSETLNSVKKVLGLTKLTNLFLLKKEVDNILGYEF